MAGEKPSDLPIQEHDAVTKYKTVTKTAKELYYIVTDGSDDSIVEKYFQDHSGNKVYITEVKNATDATVGVWFQESDLSIDEEVMYEAVFQMMMLDTTGTGCWDETVEFEVLIPYGNPLDQKRIVKLPNTDHCKSSEWMEFVAGDFKTSKRMRPTSRFRVTLKIWSENQSKINGFVIKGLIVRPVVFTTLAPQTIQSTDINVRDLLIYRGQQQDYWRWSCVVLEQDDSITYMEEVVELLGIAWLEVKGKFNASMAKDQRATYQVVFFIRLDPDSAEGWPKDVTLQLLNMSSTKTINEEDYKGKDFKELVVGEFTAKDYLSDGINFSLSETDSGVTKNGLIIQKVTLREKTSN